MNNNNKTIDDLAEKIKRVENEMQEKAHDPEAIKLSQRKRELENEIKEINTILQKNNNIQLQSPLKEAWYNQYPLIKNTLEHKDFAEWRSITTFMGFTGAFLGGFIGYKDGIAHIKQSISKAVHNPLNISQIHMNSGKIIGTMVFRTSLVYCFRLTLFTGMFKGLDSIIKNQFFNGKDNLVSTTVAGTSCGLLTSFYIRKRSGPSGAFSAVVLGAGIGFGTSLINMFLNSYVFPKDDQNKQSQDNNQK
ncbi:hypothetical protein DLAC_03351 [Tieghemostelium lacteum]|uniref:Mitochondrial import inner membrane translocase subunit TIM22 n=1 Tax=Tieghemostelium lacteum TaxID=361077 RepID=A0A152A1W1_TIELA|nr:hypothetical protein DLAC_03351 [Tieghemostelium lacteum]|eukprot:KYR00194.1 hypothetical protein DLAC_03351 [Tieghemostelium lacteum]